jgi:hypothetical protein
MDRIKKQLEMQKYIKLPVHGGKKLNMHRKKELKNKISNKDLKNAYRKK